MSEVFFAASLSFWRLLRIYSIGFRGGGVISSYGSCKDLDCFRGYGA